MFLDVVHAAWCSVAANRVRTLLTAASVAVGISSVVAMSSLARSGTVSLASGLESIGGARLVGVFPQPAEGRRARYNRGLTMRDLKVLAEGLPYVEWVAAQNVSGRQTIVWQGHPASADLVAGNGGLTKLLGLTLRQGRLLRPEDEQAAMRVALVSEGVGKGLWGDGAGVGEEIRVGAELYKVVGILAPAARFGIDFGFDANNMVFVPLAERAETASPDLMVIRTIGKEVNGVVAGTVKRLLGARHHDVEDFRVFDFAVVMDRYQSIVGTLELLAAAIAGIALLAGAAGTTNVLMVSMHEQARQIALRKALGASNGIIVRQFVVQGGIIAGLGVVIGVPVGLGCLFGIGAWLARDQPGWSTVVASRAVAGAIAAAFLITVLASLIPAAKACRQSVVRCLTSTG